MIILVDEHKAFNKIQYPFMIKALMKLGIEWIDLNIIKAVYDKCVANITWKREKLKQFPLKSGRRQYCQSNPIYLGIPSQINKTEDINKSNTN
jgi:hypothetical protein